MPPRSLSPRCVPACWSVDVAVVLVIALAKRQLFWDAGEGSRLAKRTWNHQIWNLSATTRTLSVCSPKGHTWSRPATRSIEDTACSLVVGIGKTFFLFPMPKMSTVTQSTKRQVKKTWSLFLFLRNSIFFSTKL